VRDTLDAKQADAPDLPSATLLLWLITAWLMLQPLSTDLYLARFRLAHGLCPDGHLGDLAQAE
jgi:hypothetical protein